MFGEIIVCIFMNRIHL